VAAVVVARVVRLNATIILGNERRHVTVVVLCEPRGAHKVGDLHKGVLRIRILEGLLID